MIEPIEARGIDENTQVVKFKLTISGEEYRWHGNTPRITNKTDLQEWLNQNEEKIICNFYRKIYPNAIIKRSLNETEFQAWNRWISEGEENVVILEADLDSKNTFIDIISDLRFDTDSLIEFSIIL